ncbi:MAG: polymer-forming cytoskeletal protein [Bacteroidales bacterium]|jgi:cytoskeletal protein CcmA (bactofilin family)|nr:polymer-forming cytoskeletal protein [Bacteroidales bacterium]
MKDTDTRDFGASTVNVIAQGTQLQGNMLTASDCRIDGALRGNIESKAKIIVGRSGIVEGNIKCANIEVEGTVKAESLLVSELISLKATANVIGNIETGKIAIEPGAEFSGNCKMRNNRPAAPQAPQPERK